MSKELDRVRLPVAMVTTMYPMAEQVGASRIVKGVRIPHPCGDPSISPEADAKLRQGIIETALKALQSEVKAPTVFLSNMSTSA
ncbi:MAG: glycine/betaine/sarcosine/D-proline family reductase selenoprotein B [Deltaproteobacteria bacterium]|nr:glycine/betaine/sarcosine/D-proline family reductase selenoprotein B [Deltaproteobacteria bacterium]